MHFDLTREKHIFKWTIRKLVKKEKHLSSQENEKTPIDLIKIEVDPLYSLSIGSRRSCLHRRLLQITSTFSGISIGLSILCDNLLHMSKGVRTILIN